MTRPLLERDFQRQVTDLAHLYGWEDFHVRAGRTAESWRVPGSGTMAAGWPDLVLVHPKQRRLIFAELKTELGKLTASQERVLDVLGALDIVGGHPSVEVVVWRPINWDAIVAVLSRNAREEKVA